MTRNMVVYSLSENLQLLQVIQCPVQRGFIIWNGLGQRIILQSIYYIVKAKPQCCQHLNSLKAVKHERPILKRNTQETHLESSISFAFPLPNACKSAQHVYPIETSLLNFVDSRNHMCHQKYEEEIYFDSSCTWGMQFLLYLLTNCRDFKIK